MSILSSHTTLDLQFLNNVIIIQTKVLISQTHVTLASSWLNVFLLPKTFKFGLFIWWIIPETCREYYIRYLRFFYWLLSILKWYHTKNFHLTIYYWWNISTLNWKCASNTKTNINIVSTTWYFIILSITSCLYMLGLTHLIYTYQQRTYSWLK